MWQKQNRALDRRRETGTNISPPVQIYQCHTFSKILHVEGLPLLVKGCQQRLRLHITGLQTLRKPWHTVISVFWDSAYVTKCFKTWSLFYPIPWFKWSLPRPVCSVMAYSFLTFILSKWIVDWIHRLGWNIWNYLYHINWINFCREHCICS